MYKIQVWLWKRFMIYMHMHNMDNPQKNCYVHEWLWSFSNKLRKAEEKLQTSLASFTTLDFSTSISLNFPCLIPSSPPIDFASLLINFFWIKKSNDLRCRVRNEFPFGFFIMKQSKEKTFNLYKILKGSKIMIKKCFDIKVK